MTEATITCDRCGNLVTPSETVWFQDSSGRLRMGTLADIDPAALDRVRVWHAGCLHTGHRT